jgi:hypothetical protein
MTSTKTRRPWRPGEPEVNPTTLPGGMQDLGDGRLDAFVGVGDHELDPAQAAPGRLAQKLGPERLGSDGPISMPSTSQRPSLLTATATSTAADTIRPLCLTFT